jgi:hypothetical protein
MELVLTSLKVIFCHSLGQTKKTKTFKMIHGRDWNLLKTSKTACLKNTTFDVTPCNLVVEIHHRFGGTYCLHLRGR